MKRRSVYERSCNQNLRAMNNIMQEPEQRQKLSDAKRLWMLQLTVHYNGMPCREARMARSAFHESIKKNAENGKIALVFSGTDCDCVRYAGDVRIVEADWKKIDAYLEDYGHWADGPWGYHFEKPSVAEGVKYRSRDLALEAFEDGHPYSIVDPGHC